MEEALKRNAVGRPVARWMLKDPKLKHAYRFSKPI